MNICFFQFAKSSGNLSSIRNFCANMYNDAAFAKMFAVIFALMLAKI